MFSYRKLVSLFHNDELLIHCRLTDMQSVFGCHLTNLNCQFSVWLSKKLVNLCYFLFNKTLIY